MECLQMIMAAQAMWCMAFKGILPDSVCFHKIVNGPQSAPLFHTESSNRQPLVPQNVTHHLKFEWSMEPALFTGFLDCDVI
jgi:hypothetical protein